LVGAAVPGHRAIQTLKLRNSGPVALDITLHEINPAVALRAPSGGDLTGRRILYDRAHGEPSTSAFDYLIEDAISAGATISENLDYPVDAAVLEGYDVLWVSCCGGTAWDFGELNAVNDWLHKGGAILVHGESSPAAMGPASIYDIRYQSASCTSGTTTDIMEHPISAGVGSVYVEWTCQQLTLGSSAEVVVYDTGGQPHIVAAARNRGKMVVVGSEDLSDSYIGSEDNRLLANNILAWLGRPVYSDVPWLIATPRASTIPLHSLLSITLELDATGLSLGSYQGIVAIEHNDPSQRFPIKIPVHLNVIERWTLFLPLVTRSESG
jgi:hypothetical protein